MKLSDAVQGFLLTIAGDGLSPFTVGNYRSQLDRFIRMLGDREIHQIKTSDLRAFFVSLRSTPYIRPKGGTTPLSEATIHAAWKAIRSFFKWADNELKTGRPDLAIPMPKVPQPEVLPFSENEIKALLKACEYSREAATQSRQAFSMKRPTRYRDRALVLLLLDTGIRAGECSRLVIGDIDIPQGEVTIRPLGSGAKSKSRHVFMGKGCKSAVWKYLTTREDPHPDEPLFLSERGGGMDRIAIGSIVQSLGERAGVKNVHPHRFRHTFAIQSLRNGTDIFTLQRMLGHSSLEMVRYYLTMVDTDVAEAHRKASPVDRWHL